MDWGTVLDFLKEIIFLLIVFGVFFLYTLKTGRQTITNIIMGLYFALLISLQFPYYDFILGNTSGDKSKSILMIFVFLIFSVITTKLFSRILPREYDETTFEGFGKKILLAAAATVLVMIYSYHVLPVTDLITPGSPVNFLFGSEQSFFWWLLAPIIILFIV